MDKKLIPEIRVYNLTDRLPYYYRRYYTRVYTGTKDFKAHEVEKERCFQGEFWLCIPTIRRTIYIEVICWFGVPEKYPESPRSLSSLFGEGV
ncbi:hypothetical protein J2TS4_06850 [Paenibacillus sp. J2TS4]|nr:hypothetical protein J2TS4_06850 [Paenibacillus sp. J2TS4]